MDHLFLEKIKRLTIIALLDDPVLMGLLVLKGGNALNLAYELSNRGSIDIDFSMESDFSPKEKVRVRNQLEYLLNKEFNREELVAFDIRFFEKPKIVEEAVKDFWGGYQIEFKLLSKREYDQFKDTHNLGKRAIPVGKNKSTKFTVDISKYEYVQDRRKKDLDGTVIYVYSPEMLVIEKLRAICQQVADYKNIVLRSTPKSRARDFYDIHNLMTSFPINLSSPENLKLTQNIFEAKKVPLTFLSQLAQGRELHRESWESVKATVSPNEILHDFDYYFDFVLSQSASLTAHANPLG